MRYLTYPKQISPTLPTNRPHALRHQWQLAFRGVSAFAQWRGNNKAFRPGLALAMLLSALALPAFGQKVAEPPLATDAVREGFAFYFKDFKLEHQGELHLLNIAVRYDYVNGIADKDYPNYVPMAKMVEEFLTNYPSKSTYWEIINKQLTQRLLAHYPALQTVTVELQVPPTERYPLTRTSTVTRTRKIRAQRLSKAR